jgi:hypothetical protein
MAHVSKSETVVRLCYNALGQSPNKFSQGGVATCTASAACPAHLVFLVCCFGSTSRKTIFTGRRWYIWLSKCILNSSIFTKRDDDCSPGFAGRPVSRATSLNRWSLSECAVAEADYGFRLCCPCILSTVQDAVMTTCTLLPRRGPW